MILEWLRNRWLHAKTRLPCSSPPSGSEAGCAFSMTFAPSIFVIHNVGSADRVGFDGNFVRRVLAEGKMGGYHFLAETVDGQFWSHFLNRPDRPAEHVRLHNSEAVGYSFVADFNVTVPTGDLLQSAAPDVAGLLHLYGLTPKALIAHRDVQDNKTDCPGRLFSASLFEEFRDMVTMRFHESA